MIDARKEKAIQLLLEAELKITEIAKEVGVVRQTIYDWMKDPEFSAELDSRRQEIKDLGMRLFANKFSVAAKRYWDLIENTDNSETQRKALEYYMERFIGKIPTKAEITDTREDDKDKLTPEDIEAELAALKGEQSDN
ncbi:phBC6A51 family helix-turn-helix protein [Paenibacillus naphthalenovorans]|uniref:phBC6A51 family helix-turn-helix protein n=1 Tax=Paenibacillus naphthalenovorans TaxID=162209 RepID=UPI003D27A678